MMRLRQIFASMCIVSFCAVSADKGEEETAAPFTGSCHCGRITYEVTGSVKESNYCDCRACQKASGTLKVPFVVVARSAFKITKGTPSQFRAKSGVKCDANGTWHFCPNCGTNIFWLGNRGDTVDIFAGTLDDPDVFKPKS